MKVKMIPELKEHDYSKIDIRESFHLPSCRYERLYRFTR